MYLQLDYSEKKRIVFGMIQDICADEKFENTESERQQKELKEGFMKEMVQKPYSGLFMYYLMFEGGNQYNDSQKYLAEAIKNTEDAGTEIYDTIEYLIGEDLLEAEFDMNYIAEIVGNHPK